MRRLILLSLLSVAGCASQPTPIAYECPQIILPADPIPATKKLTAKSTPAQVMKAWVATAYAYRGWNKTVRKQVEINPAGNTV